VKITIKINCNKATCGKCEYLIDNLYYSNCAVFKHALEYDINKNEYVRSLKCKGVENESK